MTDNDLQPTLYNLYMYMRKILIWSSTKSRVAISRGSGVIVRKVRGGGKNASPTAWKVNHFYWIMRLETFWYQIYYFIIVIQPACNRWLFTDLFCENTFVFHNVVRLFMPSLFSAMYCKRQGVAQSLVSAWIVV